MFRVSAHKTITLLHLTKSDPSIELLFFQSEYPFNLHIKLDLGLMWLNMARIYYTFLITLYSLKSYLLNTF